MRPMLNETDDSIYHAPIQSTMTLVHIMELCGWQLSDIRGGLWRQELTHPARIRSLGLRLTSVNTPDRW